MKYRMRNLNRPDVRGTVPAAMARRMFGTKTAKLLSRDDVPADCENCTVIDRFGRVLGAVTVYEER